MQRGGLPNDQDLMAMNTKFSRGDICLWCDGQQGEDRVSRDRSPSKKRSSKRDEKEKEVDEVFKYLKDNMEVNTLDLNLGCGQG